MDAAHKPVQIAEVIAGGQTIATHCMACGHRGELDPRVLAVRARPRPWAPSSAGCAATAAAHDSRGVGLQTPPRMTPYNRGEQ
jgi:hypothetical protein